MLSVFPNKYGIMKKKTVSVFQKKYGIIKERHCLYSRISTVLWRKDTVCISE